MLTNQKRGRWTSLNIPTVGLVWLLMWTAGVPVHDRPMRSIWALNLSQECIRRDSGIGPGRWQKDWLNVPVAVNQLVWLDDMPPGIAGLLHRGTMASHNQLSELLDILHNSLVLFTWYPNYVKTILLCSILNMIVAGYPFSLCVKTAVCPKSTMPTTKNSQPLPAFPLWTITVRNRVDIAGGTSAWLLDVNTY